MFKKVLLSITVLFLTTTYSYAGNVQTFGIGANSTAQSEAVAANANDPFAVYYNPAGLVLNDKVTFTIGGMGYHPKIEIENFNDTFQPGAKDNFRTEDSDVIIPHAGFSMPINNSTFLGVAFYSPYGLHVKWNEDTTLNPGAIYATESYYGRVVVSPTLAYKVNEKLSFGIGVSLGQSVSEASRTLNSLEAGGLGLTNGATLTLEAKDDFNYSFNAGVMYRPVNSLSFGLTYRGRTDTDFTGDAIIKDTDGTEYKGTVSMEYDHPESAQAGVRYFASENFSVEFDATWTRWSILENQVIDINIPSKYVNTKTHKRNWEDTIQYKIGAEWRLLSNFALRAGYTYDPTPVPEETFDLGWPDTDRNVFNLGFGWNITENWTLDSVLQHVVSMSKREVNDSSELSTVSLTDKGTLWGLGFTLSYSL
ncbi:MAG: outer membrane beta-barrel protein [Proteobacteria bacterium]|nr:outer membrane beta-barrel protein [Pseudomonadota bacterium]